MIDRLAYSVAEAAEALGVSDDTVGRLCARGELRSVKVGSRRVIPAEALHELLSGTANRTANSGPF